eukprot:gene324-335_t
MFTTTPPSSYLLNAAPTPAPIPGPSLALVGNQPSIVNEGVSSGGNVAVEGQITQILRRSVGVVQIRVQMIAGNVTDPLTLFGQAFEMSYAQALQADGKQVSSQDSMQVTLKHDGIRANGGWWGTPDMPIVGEPGALEEWVARWSEAMQSGEEVDLSQGLLQDKLHHNLSATYALLSEHDADSELLLEQIHQMLLTLVEYKKEDFVVEKRHDANQKADEFFKSVKEAKEKLISALQNQHNGNSELEPENSDEPVPPNQEPKLAPLPLVRQGHGTPVVPETPIETPPPLPVSLPVPECSDSEVKEEPLPSP